MKTLSKLILEAEGESFEFTKPMSVSKIPSFGKSKHIKVDYNQGNKTTVKQIGIQRVMEIINNSENIKKELGTTINKFIGHGSYGYAYRLNNGEVLKVSNDRKEAEASYTLREAPNKNIVKIYDSFQVRLKDETAKDMYLIREEFLNIDEGLIIRIFKDLKEAINSLLEYDKKRFFDIDIDRIDLYEQVPIIMGEFIMGNNTQFDEFLSLVKELNEDLGLKPETIKFCEDMVSAFKYLHNVGVIWYDLNQGNVGKRGDDFVIFDFGLSKGGGLGKLEKPIDERLYPMVAYQKDDI